VEPDRSRRRSLTPLSGELREQPPPKPKRIRRRRRRERPAPTTTRAAILFGLRRFAMLLAILGGLTLAAGWAIAHFGDRDLRHTLSNAFYIAGALCIGGAFFSSAAPIQTPYYYTVSGRARVVSTALVGVALGLALLVVGALLDDRHRVI
jgi:hypothetical protein